MSTAWRFQHSWRHYRGSVEQVEREHEGSEVKNTIHVLEVGVRRNLSPRSSLTFGVPFLIAERSSPIRDDSDQVVSRTITHAQGLGDITVVLRRAFWDPETRPSGNLTGGIGLKLPTGSSSVQDTRTALDEGEFVRDVRTVDQSIQPGDGGFGIILDLNGYRQLGGSGRLALYGAGMYLANPRGKNGSQTYRGDPLESEMSVADQYVARTGFVGAAPFSNQVAFSLGARWEGIPAHDLLGPSDGFRRPGYAVSVEPGASWSNGINTISLSVPVAVSRERVRNHADLIDGGHGDAAFADYLVLVGYSRKL